jgi:DNA invertase Pin-like site-specific DNA recombinase
MTITADRPTATEPAAREGALVGYGRVSTREQNLDRQRIALEQAGCIRVFTDKLSGKNLQRPELAACLDYLRPGDTLVVLSLDRLGRSLPDLIATVGELRRREVGFRSLHEALDTTTPGGRLVFHVFAALAEFIRELIVQGTHEGLAAAKARGQQLGRPRAMDEEMVARARRMLAQPEETVSSIAKLLGVGRATLYRYLPELQAGQGRRAEIEPGEDS